jgi:uncharacterized protein (TIGR02145 family)
MKTKILFLMVAAAMVFAGCDEKQAGGDDPDVTPTLSVSPASISAPAAGDAYTFSLACNTVWTAAVSSGATWCMVQPTAGNGDGTGTITIVQNMASESRTATVTFTAGTLTHTVTVTQAVATTPDDPTLSVAPDAVSAAHTAGTYQLQVTATQAWSAEVNASAAWCTISLNSYAGNHAVTVSVAENHTVGVQRAATILFTAGTRTQTVAVTQDAVLTPPNAASTQIWIYGLRTWSAAIHIPECNKSSFSDSFTDPHCRSYAESGHTWYYYNWEYVHANASTLCPDPWRVPGYFDYDVLVYDLGGDNPQAASYIIAEWGYGGQAVGSAMAGHPSYQYGEYAYFWSGSQVGTAEFRPCLYYSANALRSSQSYKSYGFQVRCVKDY